MAYCTSGRRRPFLVMITLLALEWSVSNDTFVASILLEWATGRHCPGLKKRDVCRLATEGGEEQSA